MKLTLIDKQTETIDGKTNYIYKYSYIGKKGDTRYKIVRRSYVSKHSKQENKQEDSDISADF